MGWGLGSEPVLSFPFPLDPLSQRFHGHGLGALVLTLQASLHPLLTAPGSSSTYGESQPLTHLPREANSDLAQPQNPEPGLTDGY